MEREKKVAGEPGLAGSGEPLLRDQPAAQTEVGERPGYVYVFARRELGLDGPCKVGRSFDPPRRLKTIQCETGEPLILLASYPTADHVRAEQLAHDYLDGEGRRVEREWFRLDERAVGEIGRISGEVPRRSDFLASLRARPNRTPAGASSGYSGARGAMDVEAVLEAVAALDNKEDLRRILDACDEVLGQRLKKSAVIERREFGEGLLQLEYRTYPGTGRTRGPYWYYHYREGGRQRTLYVGATNDPESAVAEKLEGRERS